LPKQQTPPHNLCPADTKMSITLGKLSPSRAYLPRQPVTPHYWHVSRETWPAAVSRVPGLESREAAQAPAPAAEADEHLETDLFKAGSARSADLVVCPLCPICTGGRRATLVAWEGPNRFLAGCLATGRRRHTELLKCPYRPLASRTSRGEQT
jgi:hypothetical protein